MNVLIFWVRDINLILVFCIWWFNFFCCLLGILLLFLFIFVNFFICFKDINIGFVFCWYMSLICDFDFICFLILDLFLVVVVEDFWLLFWGVFDWVFCFMFVVFLWFCLCCLMVVFGCGFVLVFFFDFFDFFFEFFDIEKVGVVCFFWYCWCIFFK